MYLIKAESNISTIKVGIFDHKNATVEPACNKDKPTSAQ